MPRRLLAVYAGLLVLLTAASAAGGLMVFRDLSSGDPIDAVANRHAYDVMGWELRHFPQKWLYKLANIFDDGRSRAEGDALLRRYFALTDEIGQLERRGDGADLLAEARRERDEIENDVEETLESRISDFLRDQGLAMNPPLFSDIDLLFPPVDFALDRPSLLAPGLGTDAVTAIESETEESGVSAIVVNTGGVATYPSIVPELAPFSETLETV